MSAASDQHKRFGLGPIHLAAAAVCLGIAVLTFVGIMWSPLAEEYFLTEKAPSLEEHFGFKAAYLTIQQGKSSGRVFALTRVTPGGILERSGFRAGDRLCAGLCRFYGDYVMAETFLGELARVRAGETVEFVVSRGDSSEWSIHRFVLSGAQQQEQ